MGVPLLRRLGLDFFLFRGVESVKTERESDWAYSQRMWRLKILWKGMLNCDGSPAMRSALAAAVEMMVW